MLNKLDNLLLLMLSIRYCSKNRRFWHTQIRPFVLGHVFGTKILEHYQKENFAIFLFVSVKSNQELTNYIKISHYYFL